jgi:hypothetical protein
MGEKKDLVASSWLKPEQILINTSLPQRPRGCFLIVDSAGNVVADRLVRWDFESHETWLCEYFGDRLILRRLNTEDAESVKLHVPFGYQQSIERRRQSFLAGIVNTSKHEAGHATMCYVLHSSHLLQYPIFDR